MTDQERVAEVAALLGLGVLRRRQLARRCGESPPPNLDATDLNQRDMKAVIVDAVDDRENGEAA